jgi:sRNA-binding carbon storage regulator CsrA
MLVFSRKQGETIVISGGGLKKPILVHTLVAFARIGFDAERDVIIDRIEIHERKKVEAELEACGQVEKPKRCKPRRFHGNY